MSHPYRKEGVILDNEIFLNVIIKMAEWMMTATDIISEDEKISTKLRKMETCFFQ